MAQEKVHHKVLSLPSGIHGADWICFLSFIYLSEIVRARCPLVKDPEIDYEIDSDEEWEEVRKCVLLVKLMALDGIHNLNACTDLDFNVLNFLFYVICGNFDPFVNVCTDLG